MSILVVITIWFVSFEYQNLDYCLRITLDIFLLQCLQKVLQDFTKVIKEYIGNNGTHKIE